MVHPCRHIIKRNRSKIKFLTKPRKIDYELLTDNDIRGGATNLNTARYKM